MTDAFTMAPEENGINPPPDVNAPVGPVGPTGPPEGPVCPMGPGGPPDGPVCPVGPGGPPDGPVDPVKPTPPLGPGGPATLVGHSHGPNPTFFGFTLATAHLIVLSV